MDTKFILIGILLLVVFLQLRNTETFKEGILNMNSKEENCNINTKVLNDVNRYQNQACKEDDKKPYRQVGQDRLTCRQFEDKQIHLVNDRASWCKGVKGVPQLESYNKVGNFEGLGKLEYNEAGPQPASDDNLEESNFPFEMNMVNTDFLNMDNKQLENK